MLDRRKCARGTELEKVMGAKSHRTGRSISRRVTLRSKAREGGEKDDLEA